MHNARRFQRVDIEVPARIEVIESRNRRKIIQSYISNLSAVGAFFPALNSIAVAQRVQIDVFLLFDGHKSFNGGHELVKLAVTGYVSRSESTGTAVAFDNDYQITSSRLCDGQVETTDVDEGRGAYECFEFMAKQYAYTTN